MTQAADGTAGWRPSSGASGPFDLLLTDVVMPGPMNGKALADEVDAALADARACVFMSGYSRQHPPCDAVASTPAGSCSTSRSARATCALVVRKALDAAAVEPRYAK